MLESKKFDTKKYPLTDVLKDQSLFNPFTDFLRDRYLQPFFGMHTATHEVVKPSFNSIKRDMYITNLSPAASSLFWDLERSGPDYSDVKKVKGIFTIGMTENEVQVADWPSLKKLALERVAVGYAAERLLARFIIAHNLQSKVASVGDIVDTYWNEFGKVLEWLNFISVAPSQGYDKEDLVRLLKFKPYGYLYGLVDIV